MYCTILCIHTFQSTPSAWRETYGSKLTAPRREAFQSTPSAWRETLIDSTALPADVISIHSLRMEGDPPPLISSVSDTHFNPLPPHGGRRPELRCKRPHRNFNPLPPHGGRLVKRLVSDLMQEISIHSLRMEGDDHGVTSARINPISIHSLRMEGDYYNRAVRDPSKISIHSLRMEGDSKTAQESVFHFAYPCTILQKRMQKTTFCTRKNGFFRKKGEKFGAKPSASFCAPMIRTDTFPLNFSHRISGSSMSMVSFAPICSTFD